MEFVKDFLIYEAGALCGFFIAALMNAARAGQEITIKFEEDKHGTAVICNPNTIPQRITRWFAIKQEQSDAVFGLRQLLLLLLIHIYPQNNYPT